MRWGFVVVEILEFTWCIPIKVYNKVHVYGEKIAFKNNSQGKNTYIKWNKFMVYIFF